MSKTFRYLAPFATDAIALSAAEADAAIAQAQTGQIRSLDHVDLRLRAHSDQVGFVAIEVGIDPNDDDDELREVLLDVMRTLQQSDTPGVRGQRGVLMDTEVRYDDEGDPFIKVWIGRNVWFNKHRVTAGFPAQMEDLENLTEEVEQAFEVEGVGVEFSILKDEEPELSRDEVAQLMRTLRAKLDRASIGFIPSADPQEVLEGLIDNVQEWLEEAREAAE